MQRIAVAFALLTYASYVRPVYTDDLLLRFEKRPLGKRGKGNRLRAFATLLSAFSLPVAFTPSSQGQYDPTPNPILAKSQSRTFRRRCSVSDPRFSRHGARQQPAIDMAISTSSSDTVALSDVLRVAEEAGRAASTIVKARLGADVIKSKASRGDLLTEVDGLVQEMIEASVREAFPSHAFLGEESVPAGAKASAEALEAAMQASASDWLWICDPIDGTTNFVQSLPMVGISIGVARRVKTLGNKDGEQVSNWELVAGVIVDPFKGEVFSASAGGGAFLDGEQIHVGDEGLADAVVATGFAPNAASLGPMVRGISAVGARARTVRMLGSAAIMLAWVACGRLSAYFEADLNAWDTAAGVLLIREAGGIVTDLAGAPFEISTRPLLASNKAAHAELQETLAQAGVVGLDDV